MKKTILLALLAVFFCGGCSTHISPLHMGESDKVIFVTDEEERVFSVVQGEIAREAKSAPKRNDLDGVRGFQARYTWGVDFTNYYARVFPAIGITGDNEKRHGYYVDVSASGTMMTLKGSAQRLYESICSKLAEFARPVPVVQLLPGKYRTADIGTLGGSEAGPRAQSIADEISKLSDLRERGLITQEEFEQGKRKLLGL